MKPASMKVTRVLWVGVNGYQRNCHVSLSDFDGLQIVLSISFTDGHFFPLRLRSIDGFRFIGKSIVNGRSYVVPATLFRHEDEYLFFGSWHHDTNSGEFIIHAQAVTSTVTSDVFDPELTPAA